VPEEAVINAVDVPCIYQLPLALAREELDDRICEYLNIWSRSTELTDWQRISERVFEQRRSVTIGMVGKYVDLRDSYLSLNEALTHGGIAAGCRVEIKHIDSEVLEKDGARAHLEGVDGVLVPGGFGDRGIEGKIMAAQYARENRIPYFGICLGMQLAVVEFARNVLGHRSANSTEFYEQCPAPVIHLLPEQHGVTDKGATMRLGAYPCVLRPDTLARKAYGVDQISERHRHRYEFNREYSEAFEAAGMRLSGTSPDGRLVEIVEIVDHPWYLGCQFHPEFKSRPTAAHPLFSRFIGACLERTQG
jgi:CTP synthase